MDDIPLSKTDIDHHYQREILLALRQHGTQTYAELKPNGVEGNAYNYHLRQLKEAKLIESQDAIYHLTHLGDVATDTFSYSMNRTLLRPLFYRSVLITSRGKVLLYRSRRELTQGRLGLPNGKFHFGDTFEKSIEREMEWRKLTNEYTAEVLCPINIQYLRDGEVAMQRPGILWHVEYTGPLIESKTSNGEAKWYDIVKLTSRDDVLVEVNVALEHLKADDHSAIDFTVEV